MAGPAFTFYYESFSAAQRISLFEMTAALSQSCHHGPRGSIEFSIKLKNIPRVQSKHEKDSRLGALSVSVAQPSAWIAAMSTTEQDAFLAAAGFLPNVELAAWAGPNRPIDWDALNFFGHNVAQRFGGWAVAKSRSQLPAGTSPYAIDVVIKDHAAFFGALASDAEYVAQNEQYVPAQRYVVVDVKRVPWGWAQK